MQIVLRVDFALKLGMSLGKYLSIYKNGQTLKSHQNAVIFQFIEHVSLEPGGLPMGLLWGPKPQQLLLYQLPDLVNIVVMVSLVYYI